MMDAGGDDRYSTVKAVFCSASWDETGTAFVDLGGDDTYTNPEGYWLSRSCHNGTSLFYEASGDDVYDGGGAPGTGGENTYHGGLSLGIFIDRGGADTYRKLKDGFIRCGGTFGVRVDLENKRVTAESVVKKLVPPKK
jgi:hypothetical protein